MEMNDKLTRRKQSNIEIISLLKYIVEKNPDLRFGQILYNYGIIESSEPGSIKDPFYDESVDILNRLKESLSNK